MAEHVELQFDEALKETGPTTGIIFNNLFFTVKEIPNHHTCPFLK